MSDDEEYTPTTKAARSMYEEGRIATSGAYDVAEFDRWLERVKREAGAAALREFSCWALEQKGSRQWFAWAEAFAQIVEEGE